MGISLSKTAKIYLVCPANYATGGTEVIHQLAYKLKNLGFSEVFLFYVNQTQTYPVHPNFEKYQTRFSDCIEDDPNHLLIVPEVHTEILARFKHIQKSIWWLSVDNYLQCRKINSSIIYRIKKLLIKQQLLIPKKLFKFKSKSSHRIFHLYQSEYAREFLEKNGVWQNKAYLSDYLNSAFSKQILEISDQKKRADQIVYNPAKGLEFTEKLIAIRPNWSWIPIQKMSPEEVNLLLRESKVYIDFGHHPGKDRLPREAVTAGCCLITGKQGAAANSVDIPIPPRYKFDEKVVSPDAILKRIELCLRDYENSVGDFETYRKTILSEEKEFENCIRNSFLSPKIMDAQKGGTAERNL